MKFAIRADASVTVGTGHVMRCRNLAVELKRRGSEVIFVCRDEPGNQINLLRDGGFKVESLSYPGEFCPYIDARLTKEVMRRNSSYHVIADSYKIDKTWESIVAENALTMVVIDDRHDREHISDVLIDQNYGQGRADKYTILTPDYCKILCGTRFALMDPAYRNIGPRLRNSAARVLVFFGGSDADNVTMLAIDALSRPSLMHLDIDVVAGSANPYRDALHQAVVVRGRGVLHNHMPNLAALMDSADLAVGAGGVTNIERMYMGLPSIVVSLADNQRPICEALARSELINYAGTSQDVDADILEKKIFEIAYDHSLLEKFSENTPVWVDGLGAMRLAEVVIPSSSEQLTLREAATSDRVVMFDWLNDPETRRHSLSSEVVSWKDHQLWFRKRLSDPNSLIFIMTTPAGLPVGQIRFDVSDNFATRLSYSLDPVFRGRGWAKKLVQLGLDWLSKLGRFEVLAEVKAQNPASSSVLESLGFEFEVVTSDIRLYRRTVGLKT